MKMFYNQKNTFYIKTTQPILRFDMEAFESKWVYSDYVKYGVNSLIDSEDSIYIYVTYKVWQNIWCKLLYKM